MCELFCGGVLIHYSPLSINGCQTVKYQLKRCSWSPSRRSRCVDRRVMITVVAVAVAGRSGLSRKEPVGAVVLRAALSARAVPRERDIPLSGFERFGFLDRRSLTPISRCRRRRCCHRSRRRNYSASIHSNSRNCPLPHRPCLKPLHRRCHCCCQHTYHCQQSLLF